MSSLPPRALSEVGEITRLVVKHARDAFGDQAHGRRRMARRSISRSAPGFREGGRGVRSLPRSAGVERRHGCSFCRKPAAPGSIRSTCVTRRSSAIAASFSAAWAKRGAPWEPAAQARGLQELGRPDCRRDSRSPGCLEGGDVVWLDSGTIVVGRGYRTNDEGIRQLREILGASIDEMIVVPLPHWKGPGDVFHLMSILSPVDDDLAVVYSPLMPVPLRERLLGPRHAAGRSAARGVRVDGRECPGDCATPVHHGRRQPANANAARARTGRGARVLGRRNQPQGRRRADVSHTTDREKVTCFKNMKGMKG